MKRILSVFLSAALCLSLLAGCGRAASSSASSTADGPQRYSTVFYDAFDTVTQVIAYCDSEEEFAEIDFLISRIQWETSAIKNVLSLARKIS